MRENRKALMFLTDDRIAVYEGDIITEFISGKGDVIIRWYPKSCDFKHPDESRIKTKSKYRNLDRNEYVLLEKTGRLKLFLQPNLQARVCRVAPEKRKPLLRLPLRGLSPRWV
jgi:hypothetical protein